MRIGVTLSPLADWPGILAAARQADELGLDSIGFYDHFQSPRPEWGYVSGWSAYGALAQVTERIRLVPMVLCAPHYSIGVLAKESSILALVSGERFELGIGVGDSPSWDASWDQPFPPGPERIAALAESVAALRQIWRGESVTFTGSHVHLDGAICTPAPAQPPRVVVGVGKSRKLLASALDYADELNVYADAAMVEATQAAIAAAGRPISLSVFVHFDWGKWPDDLSRELEPWRSRGVDRVFVDLATGADLTRCVAELAAV